MLKDGQQHGIQSNLASPFHLAHVKWQELTPKLAGGTQPGLAGQGLKQKPNPSFWRVES
jgi:hypothetical protein